MGERATGFYCTSTIEKYWVKARKGCGNGKWKLSSLDPSTFAGNVGPVFGNARRHNTVNDSEFS